MEEEEEEEEEEASWSEALGQLRNVELGDPVLEQERTTLDVNDAVGKFFIFPAKWFKWGDSERIPFGYAPPSQPPPSSTILDPQPPSVILSHLPPPSTTLHLPPPSATPRQPLPAARALASVTAQIVKAVRADKMAVKVDGVAAFKAKMYDGEVNFYVAKHPRAAPGDEDIYLTHPDVIMLAGEPL